MGLFSCHFKVSLAHNPFRIHLFPSYFCGGLIVIEKLILLINNKEINEVMRSSAAFGLGKTQSEQARKALISILADKNNINNIRSNVVLALGEIGNNLDFEIFIKILFDKSDEERVRSNAVIALAKIDVNRACEVFLNIFADKLEHRNVRREAAFALARIGNPEATQILSAILVDKSDDDRPFGGRWSAATALGSIGGDNAIKNLLIVLKDKSNNKHLRIESIRQLAKQGGNDVIVAMRDLLLDRDMDMRGSVVYALGELGREEEQKLLLSILADITEEADIHASTVRALGKMGDIATVSSVLKNQSANVDVRIAAAEIISEIGGPDLEDLLLQIITNPLEDEKLQLDIAKALSKTNKYNILRDIAINTQYDEKIRFFAFYTFVNELLYTITRENFYAIKTLLTDISKPIRYIAAYVLARYGDISHIKEYLKDTDKISIEMDNITYYYNQSAAEALEEIGTPEALETTYQWRLSVLLDKTQDKSLRYSTTDALRKYNKYKEKIKALLLRVAIDKSDDIGIRYISIKTLIFFDGDIPTELITILMDKSENIELRSNIVDEFQRINNRDKVSILLEMLSDKTEHIDLIRKIIRILSYIGGDHVFDGLVKIIKNEANNIIRGTAVTYLSEIRIEKKLVKQSSLLRASQPYIAELPSHHPGIVPILRDLLSDTSETVDDIFDTPTRICDVAAEALENIGTPEALEAVRQWREGQEKEDEE
jgi:HEAT repeat protein